MIEGWIRGQDELSKAIDIGVFLFSKQAVEQIQMLQKGLSEQSVNDFSWENLQNRKTLIENYLNQVRETAKSDLKI